MSESRRGGLAFQAIDQLAMQLHRRRTNFATGIDSARAFVPPAPPASVDTQNRPYIDS